MYNLIYRNGTQPSSVNPNDIVIFTEEEENVVVKSSGIPDVSLKKIYADLIGGTVYLYDKLRIECIEAPNQMIQESAGNSSLRYVLLTVQGRKVAKPIYPIISSMQSVKNIRDISFEEKMLFNADTSIKVASIPAKTTMKYYFYPSDEGTPTGQMLRGNTEQKLRVPNLNFIDLGDIETE